MPNRWIITSHRYHEHARLDLALAEKRRLEGETGKTFRIYRVKTALEPDEGERQHGEAG